jgi:hypothetical protein
MVTSAGPIWTDVLTGVGTVAVAVAAVGIAIWTDRRASQRFTQERAAADARLVEERQAADARLAEELDRADKRLADERAAADARLKEQLTQSAGELRRSATLAAIQPFYLKYHSPEIQDLRREIYNDRLDFATLDTEGTRKLGELINSLEYLGALVNNEIISFDVVRSIFHTSVHGLYPHLRAYIQRQRDKGPLRKDYARNYEKLVARYDPTLVGK